MEPPRKTVELSFEDNVAIVSLAKPPHNLLDDPMLDDLVAAFDEGATKGARAMILRSSQRHFCAGAELTSFEDGSTKMHLDEEYFARSMRALETVPIPVIAAVNGGALGGGLEIALCCDLIVAADTAFLGQVEVTVGLIPLLGGTQRLTQRCGTARAKEIAMFGRRHDPVAMERWGVINLVVPEAELFNAALSWAKQLAAGPTVAISAIKRQAYLAGRGGIEKADAVQVSLNQEIWAAEDRTRGYEAFFKTGPGSAIYEGN